MDSEAHFDKQHIVAALREAKLRYIDRRMADSCERARHYFKDDFQVVGQADHALINLNHDAEFNDSADQTVIQNGGWTRREII